MSDIKKGIGRLYCPRSDFKRQAPTFRKFNILKTIEGFDNNYFYDYLSVMFDDDAFNTNLESKSDVFEFEYVEVSFLPENNSLIEEIRCDYKSSNEYKMDKLLNVLSNLYGLQVLGVYSMRRNYLILSPIFETYKKIKQKFRLITSIKPVDVGNGEPVYKCVSKLETYESLMKPSIVSALQPFVNVNDLKLNLNENNQIELTFNPYFDMERLEKEFVSKLKPYILQTIAEMFNGELTKVFDELNIDKNELAEDLCNTMNCHPWSRLVVKE